MSGDRREEDGGYGSSGLVGSNASGMRAAIESREVLRDARHRGQHDATDRDGDAGTLARGDDAGPRVDGPDSNAAAGATLDDDAAGGTSISGGRGGRDGLGD